MWGGSWKELENYISKKSVSKIYLMGNVDRFFCGPRNCRFQHDNKHIKNEPDVAEWGKLSKPQIIFT